MKCLRILLLCGGLVACFITAASAKEATDVDLQFYYTKVLPILREHCLECHSHNSGEAQGGLVLDSRTALLTGGDTGPTVVLNDVGNSLLIKAVLYDSGELQMPPDGKMPDELIGVFKEWIRRGVPAPASGPGLPQSKSRPKPDKHWAFQPLQRFAVPDSVSPGAQVVDYLLDRSRRSAGVKAVASAEKRDIIRRLYLDLIGLPPTPEQLGELLQEDSRPSIESIVDSLLAMPEFGERWGRHWLDVARYADSNGCSIESNNTYDNAWRYRDYVIESLNDDKPYDQFVVEQIAGDQLDYSSTAQRCEQLIATGFLLLGPKAFGTGSYEQFRLDVIDEQIDTLGKAMIGMSLGCARCHDHKFDPVSTEDYYALAGIFASTESVQRAKGWRQGKSWHRVKLPGLDREAEVALEMAHEQTKKDAESGELKKQAEKHLKQSEAALKKLREEQSGDAVAITQAEEAVAVARHEVKNASNMAKVLPVISPVPVAMAVSEVEEPVNEAVRVRGAPGNRGDLVPRRVLQFPGSTAHEKFAISPSQSGRLQLAQWLVDTDYGAGALLARVAVNRVWGHLFSRPLVASADNFGLTGETPSHPELLDHLSLRFIESGWSMKALLREIVLTKTYRLAAADDSENLRHDPANTWLWRHEPKRIDVEVLRDSMLLMTGQLDRSRGGKTLQHLGLVSLGGDHLVLDTPSPYRRRSVYIPIYRDAIGLTTEIDASMGMLSTFDFADPNLPAGLRSQTVVPGQALFLMNSEFVYQQASVMAEHLLNQPQLKDDDQRIEHLFAIVYGRAASMEERQQLQEYITAFSAETAEEQPAESDASDSLRRHAWTSLSQSVFGSNEFLFQN